MIPMPNPKPRIAVFDFACCEGCQLAVLELEERLLELLAHVEVAQWREISSAQSEEYDIAFCEGSITRERDIERLRAIRKRADILVSLGTCASIRCHNALKNRWPMEAVVKTVYGDAGGSIDTIPARPVTEVVAVDYQIRGCPVSLPEFETVFLRILTGQSHEPSNDPVCVECKRNDTVCVYEMGRMCLGPATRCGCGAICTAYGDACRGCRGLIDDANPEAAERALFAENLHPIMAEAARKNPLTKAEIRSKFRVYNDPPPMAEAEAPSHDES
jgi:coenzyme F420-reducing hydrogenase gamma subunit